MSVKRRPTEDRLSQLNVAVGEIREALARAGRVVELKDHPGWVEVQSMVKARMDGVDRRLEDFEKLTPEERLLELKERKILKLLAGIVEDFEKSIPTLNEKLSLAVQARDDYKERLGA